MSVWDNMAGIPPGSIHLGTPALNDLLALLRGWYGIEADRWIDSEASGYRVVLRIKNFSSGELAEKLADRFRETVAAFNEKTEESIQSEQSRAISDLSAELRPGTEKDETNGVLIVMRGGTAVKDSFSIQNWFYFTEMWQYENCRMDLTLQFRPLGEDIVTNRIRMTLKAVEPYHLAITSFGNNNRMFVDYSFLEEAVEIYRAVSLMIREKEEMGDFRKYFTLLPQGWILYPCSSDEDALLLSGLCKNLGLECYFADNFLKLKIDRHLLPGLISYFISGLPRLIFEGGPDSAND